MNKSKKIGLIAAALVLVLTMLAEVFVYNNDGLKHKTYEKEFLLDGSDDRVDIRFEDFTQQVDEETAEQLLYQEEMNRLYYELLGAEYESAALDAITIIDGKMYKTVQQAVIRIPLEEELFVHQLQFTYPVDENKYPNYGVEARFYRDGELLNDYLLYDTVNSRLDTGFMNVSLVADEMELETYGDFKFEGEGVSVRILNDYQINWYRVVFLVGSGWLLIFLLLAKDLYKKHLEAVFVILSLWFGCSMIVLIGSNQHSWDEHIHFLRAYEASFGSTIETPEAAMGMRGKYTPEFESLAEREAVTEYLRDNDSMDKADISYQSRFIGHSIRAYIPHALFLKLSRMLNMPFDWQYGMGKLGSLICYTLVLATAIRIAKTGKKFIAILGLMPTPLFLAAEYSYDGFITAFLFLGFILWLNELLSEEYLTWYSGLFMMACFVMGSWAKQIYMFMILLLCFLPKRKFKDKKSMFLFKGMTVAVMVLVLYTIIASPGAPKNIDVGIGTGVDFNILTAGDLRVEGVSLVGQIQYILQNPLEYTVLLLKSITKTLFSNTLGRSPWLDLAYCGALRKSFSWITAALLLLAGLVSTKDENTLALKPIYKGLIAFMFFGVACVIWTSLYATFCEVGADKISGVQARYYIPLMLPFMYVFANNKLKFKWSSEWYYRILFVGVALLNTYIIYVKVIMKTLAR